MAVYLLRLEMPPLVGLCYLPAAGVSVLCELTRFDRAVLLSIFRQFEL